MPTVGEQLRAAREAQKLSIQEVARTTNMRTDHVRALEDGDYSPFPAPIYIRGSVRTYAKLLKLDVMPLMEVLNAELSHPTEPEGTVGGPGHRRGLPEFLALQLARFGWKRAVIVLGLVVAAILIVLIRGRPSVEAPADDPLGDLPPPRYQSPANSEAGYLPLPGTNR